MTTLTDIPTPRHVDRDPLQVTDYKAGPPRREDILNRVPDSSCPKCWRRGQLIVTRTTCIWPCHHHQTVLPPMHGNNLEFSPARASPQRTTA